MAGKGLDAYPRDEQGWFLLPDAEICARYQAGEPAPRIAASLGVSSPVIYARLRKNGTPVRCHSAAQRASHQLGLPSDSAPVSIYALSDPRDGAVRYVGKSANPQTRLSAHLLYARKGYALHVSRWIHQLLQVNLQPAITVLEVVGPAHWQEAESRWIHHFLAEGANLTNETPGGWGGMAGEANHNARLSDDEVLTLTQRYVEGESSSVLMSDYSIGRSTLSRFLKGHTRSGAVPPELRQRAIALMEQHRRGSHESLQHITPDIAAQVARLHAGGTKQREIARLLELDYRAVNKIVHRERWASATVDSPPLPKRKLRRLTDAEVVSIFERRSAGQTMQAIADALGSTEVAVRHVLRRQARKSVQVDPRLLEAVRGMDLRYRDSRSTG